MADAALAEVRARFVSGANKAVVGQLLDDLLTLGVLNEGEADEVKEEPKKQDQARTLLDHVRRKGPKASQAFLQALRVRDPFLAQSLGLDGTPHPGRPESQRDAEAIAAPPQETRNGVTLCPPERVREIQAKEAGQIYPLKEPQGRTRRALIICNMTFAHLRKRAGAEVDLKEMTLLLEGLGYKVELKIDLTSQEMGECLKGFASREEHKASDSTVLVLMSHGVRDGICGVQSCGKGSDILPVDDIFSIFNNKNCQALCGKPKVILIQACRGGNVGVTYVSDAVTPEPPSADCASSGPPGKYEMDAIQKVHLETDFACLYSTTPDNVSWRDPRLGSPFIVEVVKQLKAHAWDCHVVDVFQKVQRSFKTNPLQMPSMDRTTLTGTFYLFPGH